MFRSYLFCKRKLKIENVENFWGKNLKISNFVKMLKNWVLMKMTENGKLGRESQCFEEQILVGKSGKMYLGKLWKMVKLEENVSFGKNVTKMFKNVN